MGSKRIEVEPKHINTAIPENSSACMIAEAIKSAYPGAKRVHVDLQTIRWTDPISGDRSTYLTPSKAQIAIIRFDAGDEIVPFWFHLAPPVHLKTHNALDKEALRARKKYYEHKGKATVQIRDGDELSMRATRVNGRRMPSGVQTTRRKFGIKGLRINQQGHVEQ